MSNDVDGKVIIAEEGRASFLSPTSVTRTR